ncbi:MAG: hypothetical protein C4520_01200 [Candidatus Abyssobacteria bacterium SURF_5]|uniref:Uncharacterized protein n=1 Tax=Abyssobacteria bacterium (strain SURF_5) TaxID=2093360 RepID=A0A3A4P4J3_ABYX5|nr:MAG: hypothetical protein C4520_01200 [Candidatus Abyssubacteria bacterium SURF_5]
MNDNRGQSRWTARLLMRTIGAGILAVVVVMALLGVFVLDLTKSVNAFFIFWSIFFFLLLMAIVIAMLDALATIGKFRSETAKMRAVFHPEPEKRDAGKRRKSNMES